MESNTTPRKTTTLHYTRHVSRSHWRLLLIFSVITLSLFFSLSLSSTSILLRRRFPTDSPPHYAELTRSTIATPPSHETELNRSRIATPPSHETELNRSRIATPLSQNAELTPRRITTLPSHDTELNRSRNAAHPSRDTELNRSRIAVCLVGGARRFELTGPSILKLILNRYPIADLFINSPLDKNSYKLPLLKNAPRIGSVRVCEPVRIIESEDRVRVLTSANSPNGIQGLLQYFNLVEGCSTLIQSNQNFTYELVVRTHMDGYWSEPLDPNHFILSQYVVPPGSSYGGLNDRLGIGDYTTSVIALSRRSLVPSLNFLNYSALNSEQAFKAQLTTHNVTYLELPQPFCTVSDWAYPYPPGGYRVPVAALSSPGPLNGAKCRPCKPVCVGPCVGNVMTWQTWGGAGRRGGTGCSSCATSAVGGRRCLTGRPGRSWAGPGGVLGPWMWPNVRRGLRR